MNDPCRIYRSREGVIVETNGSHRVVTDEAFEQLFRSGDMDALLRAPSTACSAVSPNRLDPPVSTQEIWAAGVSYFQSRTARMEEARLSDGGSCYERVYEAERPELFFKSVPHRVVGHGQQVRIRSDSKWNVPEPELTLVLSRSGKLFGYTIGNDMSSRDIEGANPLYLPQAKIYKGSAAIGPSIYLTQEPLPPKTEIAMEIRRKRAVAFAGATNISEIKRSFDSLIDYLFRDNEFPTGCFLMTGTGIIPPDDFTLQSGDEIFITIEPIGTLKNTVL